MSEPKQRFLPIDVLRGLVMVLMSIDHASENFNRGRIMGDSIFFWKPGSPLPMDQFLTRWMTHLCAPTFVFLAGTSLAISAARRQNADKHIAIRGLLLIVFEFGWMSWVMVGPGNFLGQVLWAIGSSLLFMIPLRRLGDRALLAFGVGWLLLGEVFVGLAMALPVSLQLPRAFLVTGGFLYDGRVIAAYPTFSWLSIMAIGWVFGRRLLAWRDEGIDVAQRAAKVLFVAGAIGIALFVVLRGVDGYGNMMLHREDSSLVQWLHVSKYPPSITFACLELGIMATLLAVFFRYRIEGGPLLVIGQTALFFYLIHIHAMHLVAVVFGIKSQLGLVSAYVGGLAIVVALYPLCLYYGRFKRANPRSLAQYV